MKHSLLFSLTAFALASTITNISAKSFPKHGISMLDHKRAGSIPTMNVTSDGVKYASASNQAIDFTMKSKGRCQKLHWIKEARVQLHQKNTANWNDETLEQIIVFSKPNLNKKTWSNSWVNHTLKAKAGPYLRAKAIKACNASLDKAILSGKSREKALKDGVHAVLSLQSRAWMSCGGPSSKSGLPKNVTVDQPLKLNCQKFETIAKPPRATIKPARAKTKPPRAKTKPPRATTKPIRKPIEQPKPDLTSRIGISIGGKSVSWGGAIQLSQSDSLSMDNRGCKFRFKYDVLNIGDITIESATHKLKKSGVSIHTMKMTNIGKHQSKNVSGHLQLKPGKYALTASLDSNNKIEEKNEDNNKFSVTVNVDRDCLTPRIR